MTFADALEELAHFQYLVGKPLTDNYTIKQIFIKKGRSSYDLSYMASNNVGGHVVSGSRRDLCDQLEIKYPRAVSDVLHQG